MKNNMKTIMESWRRNLKESEAEKSEGGEILTPEELKKLTSSIEDELAPVFQEMSDAVKEEIENNKEVIDALKRQNDTKRLNEIALASIWAGMQISALVISLSQLSAKLAVKVAKKFGTGPTDPNSEYFNAFHEKVDKLAEEVKRSLQSAGLYSIIKKVIEYVYGNDPAKSQQFLEKLNLFQDLVMAAVSIGTIYGSWDKIVAAFKEGTILKALKPAFDAQGSSEAIAQLIDNSKGFKDLFTNIYNLVAKK